jgi:hypothetical protein
MGGCGGASGSGRGRRRVSAGSRSGFRLARHILFRFGYRFTHRLKQRGQSLQWHCHLRTVASHSTCSSQVLDKEPTHRRVRAVAQPFFDDLRVDARHGFSGLQLREEHISTACQHTATGPRGAPNKPKGVVSRPRCLVGSRNRQQRTKSPIIARCM